jgi:predicted TIM-barrel fold metal-dependent hydrolase
MSEADWSRRSLLGGSAAIATLALASEALATPADKSEGGVIDPDLPIVDAHHHLWPADSWRQYSAADFQRDIRSGHNVRATVFAECRANYDWANPDQAMIPVSEVAYIVSDSPTRLKDKKGEAYIGAGIVGWADLRLPPSDVGRTLDAEIAAGEGRFRGVRHNVVWHTHEDIVGPRQFPQQLLLDAGFRAGLHEVARRDLSYDVWMFHHQLPELAATAKALPELTIILDHLGGPVSPVATADARAEVFTNWRKTLKQVAEQPNVMLKIGGLGMPSFGFGVSHARPRPDTAAVAEMWRPYVEYAIETFGTKRCMFESNFPVDRASLDYRSIWNVYKTITSALSSSEKLDLYHDNAMKIYRL